MSDINRITIIGTMVRDPELKYTASGKSVASFSIANNKVYMSDGEKKETTSFFNCTAWGKQGETIAEYVKKGHRIGIDGRIAQNRWQDQDGKNRLSVEIIVESFQFLQQKSNNNQPEPKEPKDNDDIPF